MTVLDRSIHGTRSPRPLKVAPKPEDVILELEVASPPTRQPPAPVRRTPRVGCEPNMALGFFLFCPCGCKAYSAAPMRICPQCHRAVS